jgi:hypothetical protein
MKNKSCLGEVTYKSGKLEERTWEGEYDWCTSYTIMNIGFLNLLKSP